MNISTILRYLIGERNAIREVSRTPGALWIGLLFVLSAGLAREYDGEDLLHAPWHLILPLAVSLVTSFVLFAVLWLVSAGVGGLGTFASTYRKFLALFWMTGPLAWLYAIPVEQFLSVADATRANLCLLGIVATWRVILMIRVVSVVFDGRIRAATPIVFLFSDTVALVLLGLTPLPVVSLMGGIRLTESEQLISATGFWIGLLGMLSWPIWLIGTLSFYRDLSREQLVIQPADGLVSKSTWRLSYASLLVWIPILPFTQPPQQLRYAVERDLTGGRIDRALAVLSDHGRDAFPPHWDPPPRVGYGEDNPPIIDVVEVVLTQEVEPWVSELFVGKLSDRAANSRWTGFWREMGNDELGRYLAVIDRLPAGFIEEQREALAWELDEERGRTEAQRARVRELIDTDSRGTSAP